MSEETDDRELAALEAALASLAPLPGLIDRDRLLFRAGQASVRRWPWPAATACLALLSAALGIALAVRPAAPAVVQVVYVPVKEAKTPGNGGTGGAGDTGGQAARGTQAAGGTQTAPALAPGTDHDRSGSAGRETLPDQEPAAPGNAGGSPVGTNYLKLRDLVLSWGVDALPDPMLASASAPGAHSGLPARAPDPPTIWRLERSLNPGGPS